MRKPGKHKAGIRTPAVCALLLAVGLLLAHRAGGSEQVDALLARLAASKSFVSRTFSLETGVQPQETAQTPVAVHRPTQAAPLPAVAETGLPSDLLPTVSEVETTFRRAATISMNNESGLEADPNAMLSTPLAIDCSGGEPTVLIYHTHATEAYTKTDTMTYTPSGDYRTTDTSRNVVRVGAELKAVLEEHGIRVIHLTELFDHPSYTGSYGASLARMKTVLEKYPSIQVTIDVHRDAVIRPDGSQYRTEVIHNGETLAQLMFVVGTNASGLAHPDWRNNLNFAANLQADLAGTFPGLMRPLNLRRQRFNEHLRPGGLLLEVGSSGNTLEEALAAVRLFGDALAARTLPDP